MLEDEDAAYDVLRGGVGTTFTFEGVAGPITITDELKESAIVSVFGDKFDDVAV